MNILRQLGTNSVIYTVTNLFQKGAAFLLMPLYTMYLDPSAYGVLAIVTAVNGLLSIAFTLGLTSAMTRFYFDYQEKPEILAEFWGSVLTLIVLLSTLFTCILLMFGETILRPLIGNISFWPYVALGVVTTFFQPFFLAYLALLQMQNQAKRYAAISLLNFGLITGITITLVVFCEWGVSGPLVASLAAAIVFFLVALWQLRGSLKLTLCWRHLRPALSYSLPLVPHTVAGQATAFGDRIVLNNYLGTAAAGLYSVGAMVAMVVEVAAQSVNRAYVPLSMAALTRGQDEDYEQIKVLGIFTVAGCCMLGAAIAVFGSELLQVMASRDFAVAVKVIPFLVFAGVANSIYLLFVNILFYDRTAVRLVPVGTLSAAACSVLLALLLVPHYGLIGAAVGALLAQIIATVLIAWLGYSRDPVNWPYGKFAVAFSFVFLASFLLSQVDFDMYLTKFIVKLAGLLAIAVMLGTMFWGRPFIFATAVIRLVNRQPEKAALLFFNAGGKP